MPSDSNSPRQYQGVMISSTFTDLERHRAALINAVNGQGLHHVAMENDSAKADVDVIDSSLQMVRDAAAYVGLISHKYGQMPVCPDRNPQELSITELEFNEAERLERPILLFIMGDNHPVRKGDVETSAARIEKLNAFREGAKRMRPDSQVHRVYATFDSLEEFTPKAVQAVAGLRRHLDERAVISTQPAAVHPTLAPSAPIPHELPSGAKKFFGRQTDLETLTLRLAARENTAVVGDAGMGKTALAAEALGAVVGEPPKSLAASPYPDGVVYLDLYAMHGAIETALETLANKLAGPGFMERSPAPERAAAACYARNFLIVIEGAEEADGKNGRPDISELLNVLSLENRWLLLTRLRTQALASESLILEDALPAEDAAKRFDSLTQGRVKAQVRQQTLDLLAGHPLALTWAGNLLAQGDESPEYLVRDWSAAKLPSLSDPKKAEHTLQWLFERSVRGLDEAETQALEAAGLLAHAPFPVQAIDAALHDSGSHHDSGIHDEKATRQALKALVQRGLLRLTEDDRRQFTHVLGYRFARKETGSDPELRARLGKWLHEQLKQALATGASAAEPASAIPLLEHLAALLRTDDDQVLWDPLANAALYDFTGRLNDLGRLGQVRLALDAVAGWLDLFPPNKLEEPHWLRERSSWLGQRGDVLLAQGDLAGAKESYERSLEVQRLAASDHSNTFWQCDLSVIHSKMGKVLQAQGDLPGAKRFYQQSVDIMQRLAASGPSNADWQSDLSVSLEDVGQVLLLQGDLPEAKKFYEQSLDIMQRLAVSDPSNTFWQRDLSVTQGRLGVVLEEQDDLEGALKSYQQTLEVIGRLATSDPSNTVWQRDLSVTYSRVGDVLLPQGDPVGAKESWERCLGVRRRLAVSDPSNTGWQRDLSFSLTKMAQVNNQNGDRGQALRFAEESLNIDERLAALDPTNATWQKDVKISRALVAHLRK
jgi:tetratricopeptide (TPR) repeat protein